MWKVGAMAVAATVYRYVHVRSGRGGVLVWALKSKVVEAAVLVTQHVPRVELGGC